VERRKARRDDTESKKIEKPIIGPTKSRTACMVSSRGFYPEIVFSPSQLVQPLFFSHVSRAWTSAFAGNGASAELASGK
jgi:hypothetical protein